MSVACWGLLGVLPGRSPRFTLRACMMRTVNVYPCAIYGEDEPTPITDLRVAALLDEVNVIFRQVGLRFVAGAPMRLVENDVWAKNGLKEVSYSREICNLTNDTDGVEVYFVAGSSSGVEPNGRCLESGIVVRNNSSALTLAHEIGHACHLGDIYGDADGLWNGVCENFMPCDWNNGTGCRFYDYFLTQQIAIGRLLMFGKSGAAKGDIPCGSIYGKSADELLGMVSVGRNGMLVFPPRSL